MKEKKTGSNPINPLTKYKEIWTPFCFLDESGNLGVKNQPYFTVGMIKCSQPYYLQQKMRYIREKNRFYFEMKFGGLNKSKIGVALEMLDAFFDTKSISFCSYTIDKRSEYFKKEFHSDPFYAYEQVTKQLLSGSLRKSEVLIVLADNIVTPKRNQFEVNVKNHLNKNFNRLAIAGVCRLDSRTNDLLQMTDLLIGSINFELIRESGLNPSPSESKLKFVEKFKEYLGVDSLTKDFRNYNFNIHFHKQDPVKQVTAKLKKAINQ